MHYPHCLSRGVQSGQGLKNLSSKLRPEALDSVSGSRDYGTFDIEVENGPHLTAPRSVRGDFALVTALNGM